MQPSQLDPAWSAARAALDDPAHLAQAHDVLERRRAQVTAGDTLAILLALQHVAAVNLPAPAWLADAFQRQLLRFAGIYGDAASLDEVFCSRRVPAGRPKRLASARRNLALGLRLWAAVRAVAPRHRSLNSALNEVLGTGEWGVGIRQARDLVKRVDQPSSVPEPLAHLFADSRQALKAQPNAGGIMDMTLDTCMRQLAAPAPESRP
jgi:hypothetical protein